MEMNWKWGKNLTARGRNLKMSPTMSSIPVEKMTCPHIYKLNIGENFPVYFENLRPYRLRSIYPKSWLIFFQLDTNLDISDKKESHLRKCLHNIDL